MPFIGKQPEVGAYSKLDAITTSATATYNLTLGGGAYYPSSANHLLVSLNGVMQAPQDSFTVSGSTIVFDSALTSSDNIDFIMALGDVLDIGTPSDGTVTSAKLTGALTTPSNLTVSGTSTFTGNAAASGTLTSTGLITASAGIAIGGTGVANTLDDYEEGTFVPTFEGDGAAASGQTYGATTGHYVKVGSLVYVGFDFRLTAKGTTPGNYLTVRGLPFPCLSSNVGGGSAGWYQNIGSHTTPITFYAAASQLYLMLG